MPKIRISHERRPNFPEDEFLLVEVEGQDPVVVTPSVYHPGQWAATFLSDDEEDYRLALGDTQASAVAKLLRLDQPNWAVGWKGPRP